MSEKRTREKYINPELEKWNWIKKYVREEVNSVKSDFINKQFLFYDGHPEKGVDRFIDYVLLDEDYSVLAIIEAKRFSKSEEKGRIQARTYVNDIKKQLDKKIPIFLTNGQVWRFIDEDGIERKVSGCFSQEDLRRRGDLYSKRRNPSELKINSRIVDRPKSIQIVRELSEHFSLGHRKALVHMATGTGKTRVAMAIIDILINANVARNVLFIADRIALVNQAKSSGFQEFFTEPVVDLREGFSTTGRLYVSTVQTLMGGKSKRLVERFSPGFFDVIVFDEAHRSYYDKNDFINEYFDAIKIGLTATPRELETKNTYDLFGCSQGNPTVEYSYDEAVLDNILVPYKAEIIETERLSLGIKGSELTEVLKDQLRRQELNPEETEFTGSQFDSVFMDDKINEVIIREFISRCYKSDEGKPCKSIFFCASQRHANHMKRIFGIIYPRLSNNIQVITSDYYRSEDEVKRFILQSEPRIALSVGMLDTGVDIPEVCNLVFMKPDLQNYVRELLDVITPLMIFIHGKNVNISSFILQVEKLFGYVLNKQKDRIEDIRLYVHEMCRNILERDNLTEIKDNRDNIIRVLQEDFWEDITFSDVEFLVVQIAPLMKYYEPDPKKIIQIDAPDLVLMREHYEQELQEDEELREFLNTNPLIRKIKDGEGIMSPELIELESQLSELRPEFTIDNIQKYQKTDFLLFLHKIIGLTQKYDPKELIEYEFDKYILNKTEYNSKQLGFLLVLKKVFANRKRIEIRDLAKPPLSNERPLDFFNVDDLKLIIEKCNTIKMI